MEGVTFINEDIDIVSEINNAIKNLEKKRKKEKSIEYLKKVIFNSNIEFNYKRLALDSLMHHVNYQDIREELTGLIERTVDIYDKANVISIVKQYIPASEIENEGSGIDYARSMWKRGKIEKALSEFKKIIDSQDYEVQDKIACLHTMIYDCYNPEQKEGIAGMLDSIYTFLKTTEVSEAVIRDILSRIFSLRNTRLQETNNCVFKKHMNEWASSADVYNPGTVGRVELYVVHKAWKWICDAIEFARPGGKEVLWNYLVSWLREPPFHRELPIREQLKYKFYACEYLLQSYRDNEMRMATEFLLNVANDENYSTYVRGDALDVLLRNPIRTEYQQQIQNIRERLGNARENERQNILRQQRELGQQDILRGLNNFGLAVGGTTYADAQNVHSSEINNAIKQSLMNMSRDQEIVGNTIYKICDNIMDLIDKAKISNKIKNRSKLALTRFIEDPAKFYITIDKHFRLANVLVLVWNRIERHAEKEELSMRLIQELSEAYNTCATGHLSRIVSVLVSYYDDIKQFDSFEKQLQNNISARINAAIRNANQSEKDDLLIGMMDEKSDEYKLYVNFVNKIKNNLYEELNKEFVPKYLSNEKFNLIFNRTMPS